MGDHSLTVRSVKTIIFDLMGTCLDWYSTVTPVLRDALQANEEAKNCPSSFGWRRAFFERIHARFEAGLPQEDIDETHRRTLLDLLQKMGKSMGEEKVEACVKAWHSQKAWPDVTAALPLLRSKFDVVVLANGTARLQVDITKSANLSFDMLLSSELLGLTKPDPAIYQKAMDLLNRKPEECVMVASHAYDLRAAKKAGMSTVYLQRWTEDHEEVLHSDRKEEVQEENDVFIDARLATSESGGLLELVMILDF